MFAQLPFFLRITLLVTCVFLSAFSLQTHAQAAPTLGNLEVDRLGAAVYSLPIAAVQGTAWVNPNISVVYNSQAPNGLLGKGTSIAGLSTIKRCQQTLVRDGQNKAMTWSAEDRFCIDAQRLMLVAGSQGAADSQYRTEIDNGVIYTAKGGSLGNPDFFEAKAEDGAILTFGGTSSAKELGGATLTWALSQYQDAAKNTIEYLYEGTAADGLRIKRINYAFTLPATTLNPAAYIEFEYKDREDPISKYLAGYEFRSNKIITKINAYGVLGLLYRSYQFDVVSSSGLAGYVSRWQSVKECTTFTSCFDATQFEWGTTQVNASGVVETKDITIGWLGNAAKHGYTVSGTSRAAMVDLNGNGTNDLVWSSNDNARGLQYTFTAFDSTTIPYDANKVTTLAKNRGSVNINQLQAEQFADMNADGMIDVIIPSVDPISTDQIKWEVFYSGRNSDWLSGKESNLLFKNVGMPYALFADIDGDGITETLNFSSDGEKTNIYKLSSSQMGQPEVVKNYTFNSPMAVQFSDIKTKDQNTIVQFAAGNNAAGDVDFVSGDFNGDGNTDIVTHTAWADTLLNREILKLNWYALENSQLQFKNTIYQGDPRVSIVKDQNNNLWDTSYLFSLSAPDINGDGLSDVAFRVNINVWQYTINKGNGFADFVVIPNLVGNDATGYKGWFVDINQDGKTDFVRVVYNNTSKNSDYYVNYWDEKSTKFTVPIKLRTTTNTPVLVGDTNGDGRPDFVEYNSQGLDQSQEYLKIYGYTNSIANVANGYPGVLQQDTIVAVKAGTKNTSLIEYQTLVRPNTVLQSLCQGPCQDFYKQSQYQPLHFDVFKPEQSLSITSIDFTNYYRKTMDPFAGLNSVYLSSAKISQYVAPLPVVTKIKTTQTLPSEQNNNVEKKYFFWLMRYQSGGRGLLGFEKTVIEDVLTGVRTETAWRQDWPYTGLPVSTIKLNNLGEFINSKSLSYSALATQETVNRIFKINSKTTESIYNPLFSFDPVEVKFYENEKLVSAVVSTSQSSAVASSIGSASQYPLVDLDSPGLLEVIDMPSFRELPLLAWGWDLGKTPLLNKDGTSPKFFFMVNGEVQINLRPDPQSKIKWWKPTMFGDFVVEAYTTLDTGVFIKSAPHVFRLTNFRAPTVTVINPSAEKSVKVGEQIPLSASASGNGNAIKFVQFFANGVAISGIDEAIPYATVWVPSSSGVFSITALATDINGNKTTTAGRIINVKSVSSVQQLSSSSSSESTIPYVDMLTPQVGYPQKYGLGAEVALQGIVKSNDGKTWLDSDDHQPNVDFYANGNLITDMHKDPNGSIFWWKPTEAGNYTITGLASLGGGRTAISKAASISVAAAGMPSVSLIAPQKNGFIKLGESMTLSLSASDPDGDIVGVKFYANNQIISSGILDKGEYTFFWQPLTLGDYNIRALAIDNTNLKTTSTSVTISVVAPGTKPAVVIVSPDNGSSVPFGSLLNIYANAADFDGAIAKLDFFANDQLVGTATSAPYKTSFTPKAAGVYDLKVVAYDNLGNSTSSAVHSIQYGLAAPTLGLIDTFDDDADCFVGVSFNASKDSASDLVYELYERVAGQPWPETASVKKSVALGDIPPFKTFVPNHASGSYEYRSRICPSSNAAACSAYSGVAPFTVSSSCKNVVVPVLSLLNPPSKLKLGEPITLTAQASIAVAASMTVRFYYGEQELGVSRSAPYSVSWTPSSTGRDYLYAKVDAGNEATAITELKVVQVLSAADFANGGLSGSSQAAVLTSSLASNAISSLSNAVNTSGSSLSASSRQSGASISAANLALAKIGLLSPAPAQTTKELRGTSLPLLAAVYDDQLLPWKNGDGQAPRIEFYANNQLLTDLHQDSAGPIRYWLPVSAGNYAVYAKAYLDEGKTLTTPIGVFQIVEPALPKVSFKLTPLSTQTLLGARFQLQAEVVDPDDQTLEVRFFANGKPISAAQLSEPYRFIWTPISAETYTVEAVLLDKIKRIVHSTAVNVTINANPVIANPVSVSTIGTIAPFDFAAVASASSQPFAAVASASSSSKPFALVASTSSQPAAVLQPQGFKLISLEGADALTLPPPTIVGLSYNKLPNLLINKPLKIINRTEIYGGLNAPVAKLIIIDAAQIQLNNSIELVGETADLLLISHSSENVLSCQQCSFKNFGRVTLAVANTSLGAYLSNVGDLTAVSGGHIVIEDLEAGGIVSLELVAEHIATKGTINTQLYTTGQDSLTLAERKVAGSKVLGSGGVSLINGAFTVNYETLEVGKVTAATAAPLLAAKLTSGAINIVSSSDVTLEGILSTHSDLLAAQVYRAKLSAQPETIVIKTIKPTANSQVGNVLIKGQVQSDNAINILSSGSVKLTPEGQVDARNTHIAAVTEVFNQGTIYAKRIMIADSTKQEAAASIHLEARSIENRGSIYSEDWQTTSTTAVNAHVAGVISLATTSGDIKNRFGGLLRADTINMATSGNGRIRNGSLFAFDDPVREAQTFSAEPHNTQKLCTLCTSNNIKELPVATAGKVRLVTSANILARDIVISSNALENINPFTESTQASVVNGKLTGNLSAQGQLHFDDVKIEASHSLRVSAVAYVLNSSAIMGVSGNQDKALLQVESPVVRNERYYLHAILELMDELNQVTYTSDNGDKTTSSERISGIQSRFSFYSPPGILYSFAPSVFNFGANEAANKGLLNNAGFVNLYSDASFLGLGSVTTLGILLEKQAYKRHQSEVTTYKECLKVNNEYHYDEVCENAYASNVKTPDGKKFQEQLDNTLFSVQGRIWAAKLPNDKSEIAAPKIPFSGSNHPVFADIRKEMVETYMLTEEAATKIGDRPPRATVSGQKEIPVETGSSLSSDGTTINVWGKYVTVYAMSGGTPQYDQIKQVSDLLSTNAIDIKAKLEPLKTSYQAWWGAAQ